MCLHFFFYRKCAVETEYSDLMGVATVRRKVSFLLLQAVPAGRNGLRLLFRYARDIVFREDSLGVRRGHFSVGAVSCVMTLFARSFDHREETASSFTFRAASQISAARRPVPAVPHDVEIGELVWEHSACIVAFGCAPYCGFCRRCLVRAAECMYVHGISRV